MSHLPPMEEREWLIVSEVADILKRTGIIHREDSTNKYGLTETSGVQQTRKYIRKGELKGELLSRSRGYIVNKQDLKNFIKFKREELKSRYSAFLKTLEEGEDIEF